MQCYIRLRCDSTTMHYSLLVMVSVLLIPFPVTLRSICFWALLPLVRKRQVPWRWILLCLLQRGCWDTASPPLFGAGLSGLWGSDYACWANVWEMVRGSVAGRQRQPTCAAMGWGRRAADGGEEPGKGRQGLNHHCTAVPEVGLLLWPWTALQNGNRVIW